VQVAKLTKAKYQDNLEFSQWLKRYFDLNHSGLPYDAVGRRKGAQLYLLGTNGMQKQAPTAAAAYQKHQQAAKRQQSPPAHPLN